MKAFLRPVVACALSCALLAPAIADDSDILRQTQDRAEIEDLMWRYVRALDTFDPEAYASVYTEDGQFGSGSNAAKGRPALREMIENLRSGREQRRAAGETVPPLHHVIANSKLEFINENEARFHSYWMTVAGSAGAGSMPQVLAAGRGVDHLVRIDGHWLIRNRDVAPED
jgi:hypothetical protein